MRIIKMITCFFIINLCLIFVNSFAEEVDSTFNIYANNVKVGQEYILIIVDGEQDKIHLVDDDDSIRYIQQKTATTAALSFSGIKPAYFQIATAFVISEEGNVVKCTVLENTALNTLNLPNNIKVIEEEAFAGISAPEVNIPDGLTTICKKAFANSSTLKKIFIPSTVTKMEENIFYNSPNVVIYGYSGSIAEEYAEQNEILFISVN